MTRILKAFGYTALIFFPAVCCMIIVLILTRSAGLAALTFLASIFLGGPFVPDRRTEKTRGTLIQQFTRRSTSPFHLSSRLEAFQVRSRCGTGGVLVLSAFLNIHHFRYR
jgi:hypothetical protein